MNTLLLKIYGKIMFASVFNFIFEMSTFFPNFKFLFRMERDDDEWIPLNTIYCREVFHFSAQNFSASCLVLPFSQLNSMPFDGKQRAYWVQRWEWRMQPEGNIDRITFSRFSNALGKGVRRFERKFSRLPNASNPPTPSLATLSKYQQKQNEHKKNSSKLTLMNHRRDANRKIATE